MRLMPAARHWHYGEEGDTMFINEVCRVCALTKKAVEYYIEQGLVAPAVLENGYRDFSDADIDRLKQVSVLRGLGLSAADIRGVLTGRGASLSDLSHLKRMELSVLEEKQQLMQELARTKDWEEVQGKLLQLQRKQSVLSRMRDAFPGYYGNFICQHFAPYLNDPVQTKEQQAAFDTILGFLDDLHLEIPDDLREFYDEVTDRFDDNVCENLNANVQGMLTDPGKFEKFVEANREAIQTYLDYRQTDAYRSSKAYRLEQLLRQFNSASGYNDIFIPAMCQLSKSYQAYYTAMQRTNEQFLRQYPEWGGCGHE